MPIPSCKSVPCRRPRAGGRVGRALPRAGWTPVKPHHENLYELSAAELEPDRGARNCRVPWLRRWTRLRPIPSSKRCSARELRNEFIKYKRAEWEEYHQSIKPMGNWTANARRF